MRSKLLRVIEDKKVRPVGSNNWIEIKCRFILTTNRNLEKEIEQGNFRQDLLERIGGFILHLPPLREKLADILLLFNLFLKEYCDEYNKVVHIPPNSLDQIFNITSLSQIIHFLTSSILPATFTFSQCKTISAEVGER